MIFWNINTNRRVEGEVEEAPPLGGSHNLEKKNPPGGAAGGLHGVSRSISRVLSWTIIHLRQVSPPACSDLPESTAGHSSRIPIWSCSEWGLPSPRLLPAVRCALTAPFHPYPTEAGRYTFCCTFRRLAPPRCYLAPCPVEPGLSSPRHPRASGERSPDRLGAKTNRPRRPGQGKRL